MWKAVWFTVGWKPGLQGLCWKLCNKKRRLFCSRCVAKNKTLQEPNVFVGPCVSNTKRRKRREPSANFYVPKIFCMQRMQCILAEIWTQGTKSPRSWGSCCQSSLRKHRGHSSNIVQTCIPGTDSTPTRRSSASFTLTQLRELVGSYRVVACSCYVGWTNQMSLTPTLHYCRFECRFP